jgi:hypothetical protein
MELNQETLKQAKQELEDICKKYEITLMPVVVHQGDRTFSSIEIVPRRALQQQDQVVSATSDVA